MIKISRRRLPQPVRPTVPYLTEVIPCVHYTSHLNWSLKPIRIRNPDSGFPKPERALWVSPVAAKYGWAEWCVDNDFRLRDLKYRVAVNVRSDTCVVIDSLDDSLNKLSWSIAPGTERYPLYNIDFESLLAQGKHSVLLTANGLCDTAGSLSVMPGKPGSLYGWDCESICVLHQDAIVSWSFLTPSQEIVYEATD